MPRIRGGNITIFPLTYDGDNECYSTTASYNDVKTATENGLTFFKAESELMGVQLYQVCGYNQVINYGVYCAQGANAFTLSADTATDPLSSCSGGGPA